MVTAKECLQTGNVCRALARETKELDTRAALLEFAYEFRTVAKLLEREERKSRTRAIAPSRDECASRPSEGHVMPVRCLVASSGSSRHDAVAWRWLSC